MKIEKINDNQIRCTLNKSDLASREIKISELAYGTEKAKRLFHDMMKQAAFEFGFEADEFPLMIEAIPMSAESIVLVITKVEDPEELDTRFSRFTPTYDEDMEAMEDLDDIDAPDNFEGADEVLELFSESTVQEQTAESDSENDALSEEASPDTGSKKPETATNLTRFYSFPDFKTVEQLARILNNVYLGKNSLYKDTKNQIYYLVLTKSMHTPAEFNKVLNIASEYGKKESFSPAKEGFLREHYQTMIDGSALQILANIL